MKKLLTILLTICVVMGLCACSSKEQEPEPIEEGEKTMVGGWTINQDEIVPNASEDDLTVFNKAIDGLDGTNYEVIARIGSQVVAGRNLLYLVRKTNVTPDAKPSLGVAKVFAGLDGTATLESVVDFDVVALKDSEVEEEKLGLAGGFTVNEELNEIEVPERVADFYKNINAQAGVSYSPVAILASQVVAGTNYAILTKKTTEAAETPNRLVVLYIYAGVDGSTSLLEEKPFNMVDYLEK